MKASTLPIAVEAPCVGALSGLLNAGGHFGYAHFTGLPSLPLIAYLPDFLAGALVGVLLLPLFRWIRRRSSQS